MIFVLANVNYFLFIKKIRAVLQAKLAKYKMNPQYPSFNQIKHDALVSCNATTKDHHFDHNSSTKDHNFDHNSTTKDHNFDPNSGDDLSKLLRSCRRDSAVPSLGRQ